MPGPRVLKRPRTVALPQGILVAGPVHHRHQRRLRAILRPDAMDGESTIPQGQGGRPRRRSRVLVAVVLVAVVAGVAAAATLPSRDDDETAGLRGPPIEYPPGIPPPPVGREAPQPGVRADPEDGLTRVTVAPSPEGLPGARYRIPTGVAPGVRADGPTTRLLGLTVGGAQVDVLAFHRVPEWYSPDELAARALVVLRYFGVARSHTPLRPARMLGVPATTFRWGQPGAFTITEWHLQTRGWWIAVTLFRDRRTPPADVAAARRALASWRWTPAPPTTS